MFVMVPYPLSKEEGFKQLKSELKLKSFVLAKDNKSYGNPNEDCH